MIVEGQIVKTIMREFSMEEISAVDKPAQGEARATFLKRDDSADESTIQKGQALTTANSGHAHLINRTNHDGSEAKSGKTTYADDQGRHHAHDWVIDDGGNIIIADADGHTHGVSVIVKGEITLSGDLSVCDNPSLKSADDAAQQPQNGTPSMDPEEFQKQLDELTKRAERAERMATLNDAQRDHYAKLDSSAQEAFLAQDDGARQGVVEKVLAKAAEADPVVYTATDGTEYRKSDDARLVKAMQTLDDNNKRVEKAEDEARNATFAKRATEELGNVPGTVEARAALLKGVSTLTEEEQASVGEMLKAFDSTFSKFGKSKGTVVGKETSEDDTDDPVEVIAKKLRADDPTLDEHAAYSKALETPEGEKAYAKRFAQAD